MTYVIRLNRKDNTMRVKRITREIVLQHVGKRGPGVPIGGATGQVLAKRSNSNNDTEWVDQTGGGNAEWGQITGNLADQADLQAALDTKYDASNPDGFVTASDIGVASLNGLAGELSIATENAEGASGISLFSAPDSTGSTINLRLKSLISSSGKVTITESGDNAQDLDFGVDLTSSDVGLGNVDNTSNSTERAATATLTNKRITPRVTSIVSSATPTINTDNFDAVTITALATDITSMTDNLTGAPNDFDKLIIRIKDDGTPRGLNWGASFEAKGTALPTTTVISKVLTVGLIYDAVTAKWGCVASAQEA